MRCKGRIAAGLAVTMVAALPAVAQAKEKSVVKYDSFEKSGGYTLADYSANWSNPYGLLEMDPAVRADNRNFAGGTFNVDATPYKVGADFSVYDHLKYMGVSNQAFDVPDEGSVTFSSDIKAATPGTVDGLVQQGIYAPSGTWTDPDLRPAGFAPYQAAVLQGQQAGAVMNMVDFCTGQLFDWFVSGNTAFALIERLPSNITGNTSNPGCPGATEVGRDEMYTQIIKEVPADPGVAHHVGIEYTRGHDGRGSVEYRLDGKKVASVGNVGIPLDKQGVPYTGTYPSLGDGEQLGGQIESFSIGHGLFSLIDAFPYQHPEAPELDVSIPVGDGNPADAGRARLFGQGTTASFDNFEVATAARR
jgi:hypothetical protein